MPKFEMDYIDVASRIVEFREKHPDGSLQQQGLEFREVNDGWWVIYTAAAYRTADDERPGIGTAWEPIPGRTNFTRDSEVQNAETAAWGRAIVAALAADTKRGIASAEEVRNRHTEEQPDPPEVQARKAVTKAWTDSGRGESASAEAAKAIETDFEDWSSGEVLMQAPVPRLYEYAAHLEANKVAEQPALPDEGAKS